MAIVMIEPVNPGFMVIKKMPFVKIAVRIYGRWLALLLLNFEVIIHYRILLLGTGSRFEVLAYPIAFLK